MPQFTQWNVPSPFPNVLFNPAAVDASIADSQSKLGNLDVARQQLDLERQKLDQARAAGAALLGGGDTTTTGPATPFEQQMGAAEGGGTPDKVNAQGYAGQFQFGASRLADLGLYTPAPGENLKANEWKGQFHIAPYNVSTLQDFLSNPVAQHAAFVSHISNIDQAIASTPGADKFDANGLRAVAHLGGVQGMRNFIASGGNYDSQDANGTTLKNYYTRFAAGGPAALQTAFGSVHGPAGPPGYVPAVRPGGGVTKAWVAPGAAAVAPAAPVVTAAPPLNPNAGPRVGAVPPVPGAPVTLGEMPPNAAPAAPAAPPEIGTVSQVDDAPVPVAPSPIALRTGGTDVAGPGAGPDAVPDVPAPNRLYPTGLAGIQISAPGNPLAPPGAAQAPVTAPPAVATAQAAPGSARPPVLQLPPAPSRAIETEPLIQSGPAAGLTQGQRQAAAAMVAGGTPVATVAAQMQSWRQQNVTNRQTAATAAVQQQQMDVQRQQWEYEQRVKAATTAHYVWDPASNAYVDVSGTHPPVTPPSPRFGPQTIDPNTGKPAVPAVGGAGGVQYFPVPERPAGATFELAKDDYIRDQKELPQVAEMVQHARTSQIRWQTMLNLADKLSTGAGGATRAQLANLAETAGFPGVAQTLIAHNSEGDAAAAQEFTKLATQAAGADARSDLGSRAGLGAIRLFQSANPNVDLRPGANKGIIGMQLIAAQADADYGNAKLAYGNDQAANLRKPNGSYLPLSTFDQQWQTQRNPQVYAAAMGALQGQPAATWARGLSDDEYKRALDVVSRASPSATVNAKSGRISMQPQQGNQAPPVAVRTPADAAALPPGTPYTTPDGRTFTR